MLGKNRPCAGAVQKLFSTPVLLLRGTVNSERKIFKIAQNATSEVKERQYNVYLALPRVYSYRNVATEETVNIKLQKVTQTDCAGYWWFGFQFEFELDFELLKMNLIFFPFFYMFVFRLLNEMFAFGAKVHKFAFFQIDF